jgi:hypothetical protein
MRPLLVDKDPCPCGSGKVIEDCCLRLDGALCPWPAVTSPKGPPTGIENPGCYAACLEDCSEKLSREHFISECVLKALSDRGMIELIGLPWIPDGSSKWVSTNGFAGKVLCERHNGALSGLDSVAMRLFDSLARIDDEFRDPALRGEDRVFLFNGHDIERWMLKTLCGLAFSGNASSWDGPVRGWSPPPFWIRILFGYERMPGVWGLYFDAQIGRSDVVEKEARFAPIWNAVAGFYGSTMSLNTKRFVLAMTTAPEDRAGTVVEHAVFRPEEIVMKDGVGTKLIKFGWDTPGDRRSVVINCRAPDLHPGDPPSDPAMRDLIKDIRRLEGLSRLHPDRPPVEEAIRKALAALGGKAEINGVRYSVADDGRITRSPAT